MLSGGQVNPTDKKTVTGNIFADDMELPTKLDGDVQYPSFDKLPIVDCAESKTCPSITDEYLTNVHEPKFYDLDSKHPKFPNTTWVHYFKPGEYDQQRKKAEGVLKDSKASKEDKETAKTILSMYGFPADVQKANALLQRMQTRPDLFTYVDFEERVEATMDGQVKQVGEKKVKPLKIGREENCGEDGCQVWVFEKNEFLENKCATNKAALHNTLRGVGLTDPEILRLVTVLEASPNDFCIDADANSQKMLAVSKDFSVVDIDAKFSEIILKSGIFSPERAAEIVAAMQKAFEKERTQKELQDGQKTMIYKIIGSTVLASVFPSILGYKQYKLIQGQMGKKEPLLPSLRNLTELAKKGELEPYSKRFVADAVVKVLSLFNEGLNPDVTAEAGVGKTVVWEAVADALVKGILPDGRKVADVFPKLANAVVFAVDVGDDIVGREEGGGQYVSIINERMTRLKNEAIRYSKETGRMVILFFDEIHQLFNAGSASDGKGGKSAGAEQSLKPMLARDNPHLRIGGATTPKEHKETIAQDTALRQRFKEVKLNNPSKSEAVAMFLEIMVEFGKRLGRTLTEGAIRQAADLTEADPDSFPRKIRNLLKSTAAKMTGEQNASTTMTADDVTATAKEESIAAANEVIDKAVRSARQPTLPPEEIMERQLTSIERHVDEAVRGFKGTEVETTNLKGQVMRAIFEAWKSLDADPKAKAALQMGADPFEVPPDFSERTLRRMGPEFGLDIISPENRGILPKLPTGGTPGPTAAPATPTSTPPPAAPPTPPSTPPAAMPPAGPATPAASATPERTITQVLVASEAKTQNAIATVTKVGFAKGVGMTAVPAMAFDVAHAIGVPGIVTAPIGIGLGVAAVRAIGVGPVVEHGAAFMVGKAATQWLVGKAAEQAGIDSLREGRLANALVGSAAGGGSWYALTKGGQVGARFLTKEAIAAGGGAVASGGLLFIAQASMGSADEEDVALMLAGNADNRDPELVGLIRWAMNNEKFDINWHEAELDKNGLAGTEHNDEEIMKTNRHFIQALTALVRAKDAGNTEATSKARKQFLDYFPELGTDQ